jgi:hypothetical protein
MFTKQNIHKAFLLISAAVVLHATILAMSWQGHFDPIAFRYYTALSNFLVVIGFFAMFVLYNKMGKFRSYLSISVIIGITITGLVYNLVLIPSVEYITLSTYANFITYLVSPILALINYFVFEKKGELTIKHIWAGMVFPVTYWIITVFVGGLFDFAPYFFMNPAEIGWAMTFIWLAIIVVVIAMLGFVLVAVDRIFNKKAKARQSV